MAIKRKLTKAEYAKLSKDLKAHYVVNEDDEDEYLLDTEDDGEEDAPELRRARDREKQKAKDAKAEAKKLRERLAKAGISEDDDGEEDDDDDDDSAGAGNDGWKTGREPPAKNRAGRRKEKDIETLERGWKDRVKKAADDGNAKLSKANEFIKKSLIGNAASSLASQISTAPELMSKAIRDRLTVDFEDEDEPRLVILDKDGKASELTLDKLGKEFTANKEYAAIIRGSKASGGGASQHGPERKAPASGGASEGERSPDLSKMPSKDLAARLKAQKEASS